MSSRAMATVQADEVHYTANEIAELWKLDPDTIRDMFRDEPGVLRFGQLQSTARKRAYSTMRVPKSVLDRVHRRMQAKD